MWYGILYSVARYRTTRSYEKNIIILGNFGINTNLCRMLSCLFMMFSFRLNAMKQLRHFFESICYKIFSIFCSVLSLSLSHWQSLDVCFCLFLVAYIIPGNYFIANNSLKINIIILDHNLKCHHSDEMSSMPFDINAEKQSIELRVIAFYDN